MGTSSTYPPCTCDGVPDFGWAHSIPGVVLLLKADNFSHCQAGIVHIGHSGQFSSDLPRVPSLQKNNPNI